jgi:serine/threonine protein kinase
VTDARAATYEVASYIQAIEQLTVTTLRTILSGLDLERALSSREEINAALRGVLDAATGKWGIRVNRLELKRMEPSSSAQDPRAPRPQAPRARRHQVLETAHGDFLPAHRPLQEGDPRRVDHYRLTARLGQGGMGTVYLGHAPDGRLVAVKVIQRQLAADPSFRQRFAREISAARKVGGSHTASVVDADAHGDPPWLVTEYIPGPSLHDVLSRYGALPAKTVQALAVGIAEALEGIHRCGIVHRDLKPGNIVLSDAGPRVIDFGIARALDGTVLTRTDHVVGSRGFLAPELLTGAPVTFAADLYAFGMVLCHAAGAVPADGESLDSALGLLPSRLSGIVTRCLDHRPASRPTPADVIERLADRHASGEDWLPPLVRALVDLHNRPAEQAG